ncbi:hypothetical protein WN51_13329 [Melipona quadrifasciata]|uniref:Uncharacterized protein n=1 Tax=Melipona quadrifasciata TaxID=166423 RepID=A0A0M9A2B9_9HYME|nr:hypothetical protein WN51_13329 [Melipona quadrifasciata]
MLTKDMEYETNEYSDIRSPCGHFRQQTSTWVLPALDSHVGNPRLMRKYFSTFWDYFWKLQRWFLLHFNVTEQ